MNLSLYNGKHNPIYANRSKDKKKRNAIDTSHYIFYNTSMWHRLRDQTLRDNPLCVRCGMRGRTREATTVDHVVMFIDKHDDMASNSTNLRGLCHRCHGKVSYTERSMRFIWRKRYDEGEEIESIVREKYGEVQATVDNEGYYI